MRIEQLKYFLAIAHTGSINIAAKQLYISQQAMSESIKRLEKELGAELFKRSKSGVELTAVGAGIMPYVQNILSEHAQLENYLAKNMVIQPANKKVITLTTSPILTNCFIPEMISLLKKKNSNIELHYKDAALSEVSSLIAKKEIDFSIFLLTKDSEKLFWEKLSDEVAIYKLCWDRIVACIAKNSPYAQRTHLTNFELETIPRVSYSGFFEQSSDSAGFISNNINLHIDMVLNNNYISSTLSRLADKVFDEEKIKFLPIVPEIITSCYIMLPKAEEYSVEILQIAEVLDECVQNIFSQNPKLYAALKK